MLVILIIIMMGIYLHLGQQLYLFTRALIATSLEKKKKKDQEKESNDYQKQKQKAMSIVYMLSYVDMELKYFPF